MPTTHHQKPTERTLEAELGEVRRLLLLMAGRVETMIADSVHAMTARDLDLARRTIDADEKVDAEEKEADETCMRILATRQPQASDLRFVALSLKMVTDLERIGDLAVNISERAFDLAQAGAPERPHEDLHRLARLAQSMVRDAIDAFVARDVVKAETVIARDGEVDRLYDRVFDTILADMSIDATPTGIHCGIHRQSVAKWLERIADHGTNLAEQVIFMVNGTDVRHAGH
jgi:phosphate transport system protein